MSFAWAPRALGQDDDDAPPEPVSQFTMGEMGLGGALTLSGARARTQLTIPVPSGTRPETLSATAAIPPGIDRGWLDVAQSGRSLFRIDLPVNVSMFPLAVPLSSASVVDNAVVLDVSSTLIPDSGVCVNTVDDDSVRLFGASVDFVGQPSIPSTLSQFLPPILRQLTVFVPAQPDADESEAALSLTTSIVKYYGAQPVRVSLRRTDELDAAPLDGPFDRSVVIMANTDGNAELIYPTAPAPPRLFVTGSGGVLIDQTRLITSGVAALAVSTKASAGAVGPAPVLAGDSMTLDELGVGTLSATGRQRAAVTVPIDQTRLGRATHDLRIHLLGSFSPLPDDVGGSITAMVGDRSLVVLPTDASGRIDQWVDIPASSTGRTTNLDVVLQTVDAGAGCGAGRSVSITVDGATEVQSSGGGKSNPAGFGSIPQALMPVVDVAMTEQTFENTARAVVLMSGMQRLSGLPVVPRVVPMDVAAAGTDPAIVVSPEGLLPPSVDLPLRASGSTTLTAVGEQPGGTNAVVTVDGALPFGSVQVVRDFGHERTLLVASSSNAPAQLDRALTWLDTDVNRWFALTGDILFAVDGQDPVSLSSAALTERPDHSSSPTTTSGGLSGLEKAAIAAGAGAVAIGSALAAVFGYRSRARGRHSDVDTP